MIKLLDTSAIITLIFEAKRPDILKIITQEGYKILIPKEVYREINDLKEISELLRNGKIDLLPKIAEEEINKIQGRYPQFHSGEISVLIHGTILKSKNKQYFCVIDEKDAKKYAKRNDLKVTGIIGLLLWLKSIKKINKEECIGIYKSLKENPRLPNELLKKLKNGN